jgi:hypothetical protein
VYFRTSGLLLRKGDNCSGVVREYLPEKRSWGRCPERNLEINCKMENFVGMTALTTQEIDRNTSSADRPPVAILKPRTADRFLHQNICKGEQIEVIRPERFVRQSHLRCI